LTKWSCYQNLVDSKWIHIWEEWNIFAREQYQPEKTEFGIEKNWDEDSNCNRATLFNRVEFEVRWTNRYTSWPSCRKCWVWFMPGCNVNLRSNFVPIKRHHEFTKLIICRTRNCKQAHDQLLNDSWSLM